MYYNYTTDNCACYRSEVMINISYGHEADNEGERDKPIIETSIRNESCNNARQRKPN